MSTTVELAKEARLAVHRVTNLSTDHMSMEDLYIVTTYIRQAPVNPLKDIMAFRESYRKHYMEPDKT